MKTPKEIEIELQRHRSIDVEIERLLKITNSVMSAVFVSIVGWWVSIAYTIIQSWL